MDGSDNELVPLNLDGDDPDIVISFDGSETISVTSADGSVEAQRLP